MTGGPRFNVAQFASVSIRSLLEELSARNGVSTSYRTQAGELLTVSDDTLVYTLRALGVDIDVEPTEDELTFALYKDFVDRASRPLPPAVVSVEGREAGFVVHVPAGSPADVRIVLESGEEREVYQDDNHSPDVEVDGQMWGEASFHIPGDLPLGYHRLVLEEPAAECALIITPARLSTSDQWLATPQAGVMAQLYSVRSRNSWGMGDFADLGLLAETLHREAGASFLLINPLHAAEPVPPVEESPYLPTSRRFINPLYLNVESVPELERLDAAARADVAELSEELRVLNTSAEAIDRNPIYSLKLQVLHAMYASRDTEGDREFAFRNYCRSQGKALIDFARWCAREELKTYAGKRHVLAPTEEELSEFYMWLQFLCHEQLAAAQQRARQAGMPIGIITDLAVGVHPGGADAEIMADYLAPQCSVGAPPDEYNQQGQDWSQPPLHPIRLAEAAYEPWREMLGTILDGSGGLRIDHVLGLFRLYWIPRMSTPDKGTYVAYDFEAMLGIALLEAQRHGAVLIGEDLGTLEPWVQDVLASRGVLGTSILWFEQGDDGNPMPQNGYRPLALSSVGTHDLPPTAAYLRGDHITLRERLGVLAQDPESENAEDLQWQAGVLRRVAEAGYLPEADYAAMAREERGSLTDLMSALHAFIAGTPSALTCTSLVDLVGDVRAQNQPGTTHDMYPNWCMPLCDGDGHPVLIEELADQPLFRPVADASRR